MGATYVSLYLRMTNIPWSCMFNNMSFMFSSSGLTAPSASSFSFLSSSSKWRCTLSKPLGSPSGETGEWQHLGLTRRLRVWYKDHKTDADGSYLFSWNGVCVVWGRSILNVHGSLSSFTHLCAGILALYLLSCISLTDSCCSNLSGLLLCKCGSFLFGFLSCIILYCRLWSFPSFTFFKHRLSIGYSGGFLSVLRRRHMTRLFVFLCCWQWLDHIYHCAEDKPGCVCGDDGGGRVFHSQRCPGSHPPENGTLI